MCSGRAARAVSRGSAALAASGARDALDIDLIGALDAAAGLRHRRRRGRHRRTLSASARDALRERRTRSLLRHSLVRSLKCTE